MAQKSLWSFYLKAQTKDGVARLRAEHGPSSQASVCDDSGTQGTRGGAGRESQAWAREGGELSAAQSSQISTASATAGPGVKRRWSLPPASPHGRDNNGLASKKRAREAEPAFRVPKRSSPGAAQPPTPRLRSRQPATDSVTREGEEDEGRAGVGGGRQEGTPCGTESSESEDRLLGNLTGVSRTGVSDFGAEGPTCSKTARSTAMRDSPVGGSQATMDSALQPEAAKDDDRPLVSHRNGQLGEAGPTAACQPDDVARRRRFLDAAGLDDVACVTPSSDPGALQPEARPKYYWLEPAHIRDAQGRRPTEPGYNRRTVRIPSDVWAKMSASQKQYWEVKSKYMDTLIFFKVGSFYELYELDAEVGHKELDWKITTNGVGKCKQVGVPESGVDDACARLQAKGYKVGRVEQIETGQQAKASRGPSAMVRRELTQVITAATRVEGNLAPDAVHLLAIVEDPAYERPAFAGSASRVLGFAFVDAASGRAYAGHLTHDSSSAGLAALLAQVAPQEILFPSQGLLPETKQQLRRATCPGSLPVQLTPINQDDATLPGGPHEAEAFLQRLGMGDSLAQLAEAQDDRRSVSFSGTRVGLTPSVCSEGAEPSRGGGASGGVLAQQRAGHTLAVHALAMLLMHLQRLKWAPQQLSVLQVLPYSVFSAGLRLDGATLANLELLENSTDATTAGTLLGFLDSCVTAGGKRMLRRWVCHPLRSLSEIARRQDAIAEILDRPGDAGALRTGLQALPDLERLIGRVRAMAVPLSAAIASPFLHDREQQRRALHFASAVSGLQAAAQLLGSLTPSSPDCQLSTPLTAPLLCDLVSRMEPTQGGPCDVLADLGGCLVKHKGGSRGKPAKNGLDAPTLSPLSGWTSQAQESDSQGSSDEQQQILASLVALFCEHLAAFYSIAEAVSQLDALLSLASAAAFAPGPTCRPRFVSSAKMRGKAGRSAFIAKGLWHPYAIGGGGGAVVPNDVVLGGVSTEEGKEGGAPRAMLLTGANMGGKSTLLRATCLAVIMAQMGCHVAAEEVTLSPADVIFTRLGASDRIMSGESTFLVECKETSRILHEATPDSFVILDELGRGTSTFDGYAIAHAVLDHLTASVDCRLLFATHYHALTSEFSARRNTVGIYHMASSESSRSDRTDKRHGDIAVTPESESVSAASGSGDSSDEVSPGVGVADNELVFLYKLKEGPCPKSYGLQVAAMAGIPRHVVHSGAGAAAAMERTLAERFETGIKRPFLAASELLLVREIIGWGDKLSDGAGQSESEDDVVNETLLCLHHEVLKELKADAAMGMSM